MPKSKQMCEKIREESKEKILSKAIEVFVNKGYSSTNISDIASKANVSVGLIYRYFRSKQELFEIITSFAIEGLIEVTKLLNGDGNPKEIIMEICQDMLKEMDNEEFVNINMMMVQGIISKENPIGQKILYHDKKMFEAAEALIQRGQKEGVFSSGDASAKSALLFSSIQGMTMMKFFLKENFKIPSLSDMTAFLYKEMN